MALSKDKTRIMVNINKDLKDLLQKKADAENRSLSNFLETILINYIKKSEN